VYLSSDMWMIVYLSVVTCLPMEDSVSECSDMSTRGGVYLSVVTCLPVEDSVSECSDMSTRGG
jgi:hypothetical protein